MPEGPVMPQVSSAPGIIAQSVPKLLASHYILYVHYNTSLFFHLLAPSGEFTDIPLSNVRKVSTDYQALVRHDDNPLPIDSVNC